MFKIAHLADLGFGSIGAAVVEGTLSDLEAYAPDLIVVSGNLTRSGGTDQFAAARSFLDRLPAERLVVPGPRDVRSLNPITRMFAPLKRYHAMIESEVSPFFSAPEVAVYGIDTSRSRGTRISATQAGSVRARLGSLDAVTVLVTHQPLVARPSRGTTIALRNESQELRVVAKCVDVVLAGHQTIGSTQDTRVAYRILDRQAIVAQAALAAPPVKGVESPPYYNGVTIDGDKVTIAVRLWKGGVFEEQGPKSYRFDGQQWDKYVDMPSDFQWSDGSDVETE